MYKKINIREKYLGFFLAFLVLALRLWFLMDMNGPFVFSDEVGYWGHAANLNGLPWKNSTGLWYSYGYSLLLTPLYWISHNMTVMYRLAVVINALLGVAGFVLGIVILRDLKEEMDFQTAALVSCAASCYSAYLFQSYIAYSETLIYTLVLLAVRAVIKFCKRPEYLNLLSAIVVLMFLYIVHNRNIAGIIAFFMVLSIMFYSGRITRGKIMFAFGMLLCFYMINKGMRAYVTGLMFDSGREFTNNNIASTVDNLIKLLASREGWIRLVQSVFGKTWYILTATFMFAYTGFVAISEKVLLTLKNRGKVTDNGVAYSYVFVWLLVLGVMAVNILFMIPGETDYSQNTRLDPFFYGRYSDGISGLLILLGIPVTLKHRKCFRAEVMAGVIIYCLCTCVLYLQIYKIEDFWINSMQIPGIYFMKELSPESVKIISLTVSGVYLLWNCVRRLYANISVWITRNIIQLTALLMVPVFWLIGMNAIQVCIIPGQYWGGYYSDIYDVLNANSSVRLVFLPKQLNGPRCILRTRAVETDICYGLPDSGEDNYFIAVSAGEGAKELELIAGDCYMICHSEELYLLCTGTELVHTLEQQGIRCSRITSVKSEIVDDKTVYAFETEDMVLMRKIFGRNILSCDNVELTDNAAVFKGDSFVVLGDNSDQRALQKMELAMELWLDNDCSTEIVNKWSGWLDNMTFALAYHENEQAYYFHISENGSNVYVCSWGLEYMPKSTWNSFRFSFEQGLVRVYVNGQCIVEENSGFTRVHVSDQPVRIGDNLSGKIKNFEYRSYSYAD